MLLPNRHGSSDKYRYGFQGQEKDDEVKGEGNSLNYIYRMHDPRVGRFFAVDPLTAKFPWYSPYQFAGNKVMQFVELEGLEEQISPYLEKQPYRIVFAKDDDVSTFKRIDNAAGNVMSFLSNILLADTYNASSSLINNSYWMITGQKNYDFHNTFVSPAQDEVKGVYRYHTETPAKQQLSDLGNELTNLENYELPAQILLSHRLTTSKRTSYSPQSPKTQGLATITEKTTVTTATEQPVMILTMVNKISNVVTKTASKIKFSQNSINKNFGDKVKLNDRIHKLRNKPSSFVEVPAIRVIKLKNLPQNIQDRLMQQGARADDLFSIDNRRLYVAQQSGAKIQTILVKLEDLKDINLDKRFSTNNGGVSIKVRK